MAKKTKTVEEVVEEVEEEEGIKAEIVSDKKPVMRMIGGRMRKVN
mgnify:CR=1 FL=1